MFHVERWLGAEGGSQKSVSPLSLDRLNAKARERAAALKREKTQSSSPAPDVPDRFLDKDLDDPAWENAQGDGLTDLVVVQPKVVGEIAPEKKQKKRKKHQGQNVDSAEVEAPDSAEKVGKVKKVKVSHDGEENAASLEAPDSVGKEKKRKKGKKLLSHEASVSPGDNADWIPEGDIDDEVQEPVEVSDYKKEMKKKKKLKKREGGNSESGDESEELVEVPDSKKEMKKKKKKLKKREGGNSESGDESEELVEVSDSKKEMKKKKKLKKREGGNSESGDESEYPKGVLGEVDGVAAGGTPNEGNEYENGIKLLDGQEDDELVSSSGELKASRTVEVSLSEPDFSQIERDVDRIMGRDNSAPAEPQDKGPVLPWMRDPLDIDAYAAVALAQVPGLDIRLQEALIKTGIKTLFPVQVAVWYATVGPGLCERDVCVSSPTGSGKTLSYALPIVQKLSSRVLRLLRALVVLPTRDLAAQVKAVFDVIAPAVGLSVGLAVGQTSITAEAAELVKFHKTMVHSFGDGEGSDSDLAESHVDILVATPGRLMDHLQNTKGFTLEHLQFLVVDETDRLLRQAYQDWLPNVLAATSDSTVNGASFRSSFPGSVRTIRRCCLERGDRGIALPRLVKMVLSATLTRDPAKLAQLDLYRPLYVAPGTVGNRYQLPQQLKSFRMVCQAGEKPLYLVALLQQLYSQPTIVFTASIVATHRLYTLLSCFKGLPFKVVEYSSLQHQQARSKSLAKFRSGQAHVLVASDAMTRGMDVEGVASVVNYDMPVYAKTYVHRVGRTARAAQPGSAYTLLRREEVRHFKLMLNKVDNSKCKDYSLPSSVTEELYEPYVEALEKLKKVAADEAASTPHENRMKNDGEQKVSGPDELYM